MAKKIRFPLDMGNGVEVRTLEELQEHFSLEKVLGYYADGKLITWLQDRYMDDIVEKLEKLDKESSDFSNKVCECFGVDFNNVNVDISDIEEHNRKLSLLKDFAVDNKYEEYVDDMAFDQDDLYDLLDTEKNVIYLCGCQTADYLR